jgi:hypothetical protein
MNKNLLKILESIADDKYDGCFEILRTKVGYVINFPFQFKHEEDLQIYDNLDDAITNTIQENLKFYKNENI